MSVLARKITRGKWDPAETLDPAEIGADAVTADLRTKGNTLSFWRCDSASEADLERAVLALAAAADRADRIDVVAVDERSVTHAQLSTRDTPGETPVLPLQARHVDVEKLDYVRLGRVATLVAAAVKDAHLRVPRKRVLQLLVAAVRAGDLELDRLKDPLRGEVRQQLAQEPRL